MKRAGFMVTVTLMVLATLTFGVYVVFAANQFWNTNGTPANWTANNWGTSAAGPFTNGWTNNNDANFTANSAVNFITNTQVGNINVTNGSTVTVTPAGTLSTNGNVRTFDVGAGSILDFSSQSMSTAAGTGFIKSGAGTYFTSNVSAYTGGFTLNNGIIILGGVSAMGSGGPLTINGGTLAANATRTFTGKFTSFNIGGDFTMGAVTTGVGSGNGSATANISIDTNASLGAATRTITIGSNATYTLAGIVSGNTGSGLTVANASGATGKLTLSGANTYTGNTNINGGTLALSGSGSLANSPVIQMAGGTTFDVTGLTTALTLASGQALKATGTTSSGTIATSATKGLTTASNSTLQFTAFNGTTPPLTLSGAGTLALQSGNPVTVTVANGGTPLGAADYKLIARGASGTVSGTPTTLTVNGDGVAVGTVASLKIISGELFLHVAQPGALQLSSSVYSVNENGGSLQIPVTRTGGADGAVGVNYSTANNTANAGSDYTAQSGTLSWAGGDTTNKNITIPITDDSIFEGNETFTIIISTPTGGATLGTPAAATITINDNETAPTISVGDVTLPEPTAPATGTTNSYAQFPVTLSGLSSQSVTVTFSTADGTAVAPGDYTTLSGSVTFAPGEMQKTVAVAVKSDSLPETSETFNLNLSGPVNATLADGTGTATITPPVAAGTVIISEFRLRGPSGQNDEFIELYNNTDADIIVTDANPVTCAVQAVTLGLTTPCGWALVDLQGSVNNIPRFVVPLNTVIPARGHFLAAGTGYSLSTLTAADLTYDPPGYDDADYTGLALYKTADRAQFNAQNVFDAVGFEGVALPFREGTGLLPADGVTADAEHSFVRNQGSGRPADSGDNRADFTLVATDPIQIANGIATLGAPGPENSTGPVQRNSGFSVAVPPGVTSSVRSTSPAVTNGSLGTLSLRRRFTNNTGQTLSKLRFRVADVSTWNSRLIFGNQAEMRVLDATLAGLSGTGLLATKVETPPQQLSGGGINTGMVVNGSLTLAQPLAPGQSVDVEFLLGVMKGGSYQFVLTTEAAP
jgi:autotransporter-associated beta strand protein